MERFSPDVKLLSVELELGEKVMREAGLAPGMNHHVTERDAQGHLELVKQQYIQASAASNLDAPSVPCSICAVGACVGTALCHMQRS